ncbi:gluconokinase [Devosia sp. XJ19-1]|uniref:Gluconokinase n=1 Tax=Devosia ureilytica TaxID=2952754 RepID=A0A9Q4FS74_9HYPH|nr:gluconokinase [Devosia ureilytica]MCP8883409.1 gluconokinase [Devosia ureilytica]MCP8887017.1 gluconokinase [Devosia ureilytica]
MSTAPSPQLSEPARIIIVMGVSSSGKSTVGAALGRALHAPFLDGDGYHPEANVEKMRNGVPLTDEDRWPWLEALSAALKSAAEKKGVAVGACSALKRSYRDFITDKAGEPVLFVYLDGSRAVIGERMAKRSHEYMPTSLLDSQFATLEVPDAATENVLKVPVTDSVDKIVRTVTGALNHLKTFKRWQ